MIKVKKKFLGLVLVSLNVMKEISCIQEKVAKLFASQETKELRRIRLHFAEKTDKVSLSEKPSSNLTV